MTTAIKNGIEESLKYLKQFEDLLDKKGDKSKTSYQQLKSTIRKKRKELIKQLYP